ncbi:hypothetical protein HD806DRAFT_527660 [Xylariaceae sp. AK1471]|nr:hypothetical protein HD806DRAFT_527840 [Xylariaceae sp. AK1471]KAI3316741.1 hypothetical protein HD806DRAFT_527660 [Xylariaceae sp. AK1471]
MNDFPYSAESKRYAYEIIDKIKLDNTTVAKGSSIQPQPLDESFRASLAWAVSGVIFGEKGNNRLQRLCTSLRSTRPSHVQERASIAASQLIQACILPKVLDDFIYATLSICNETQNTLLQDTLILHRKWLWCQSWKRLEEALQQERVPLIPDTPTPITSFLQDEGFTPKHGVNWQNCLSSYISQKLGFSTKQWNELRYRIQPIQYLVEAFGLGVLAFIDPKPMEALFHSILSLSSSTKGSKLGVLRQHLQSAASVGYAVQVCDEVDTDVIQPLLSGQLDNVKLPDFRSSVFSTRVVDSEFISTSSSEPES